MHRAIYSKRIDRELTGNVVKMSSHNLETVSTDCESVVLNHFAMKAFCTLRNNNWIQLLFRKVQNALIAKWLSTALSQMSILTVGSSPDRGMRLNLQIAIVPLRRTDYWILDFQPPAAYLGDEQMLRILGRGHSVPTITELIFVRAQCLTILLLSSLISSNTAFFKGCTVEDRVHIHPLL